MVCASMCGSSASKAYGRSGSLNGMEDPPERRTQGCGTPVEKTKAPLGMASDVWYPGDPDAGRSRVLPRLGQAIRTYSQNQRVGDGGLFGSVEDQRTVRRHG